jgi:transposase
MSYEIEADYSKRYLMPPSVEEWVSADHFARFIREFVDNLNCTELGFKARKCIQGRPNYSTSLLLKVWLYGYFEQIYSSRKLEKACRDFMPLIWLTDMNYPDHNTIWRFFKNNREAMKGVFKQTVKLAIKSDMVGFALQAVDGTKIKANKSKYRAVHKRDLEDLLSKLDESVEQVVKTIEGTEEQESDFSSDKLPKDLCNENALKKAIQKGLSALSEEERDSLKKSAEAGLDELKDLGVNHLSLSDVQRHVSLRELAAHNLTSHKTTY